MSIDALSRYLVNLEDCRDGIGLPADIGALARVFPVLRRVESIRGVAEAQDGDQRLVRRRAFAALRELLGTFHWPPGAPQQDISVGPLDDEDAQRLAMALFDSAHPGAVTRAREVARESPRVTARSMSSLIPSGW